MQQRSLSSLRATDDHCSIILSPSPRSQEPQEARRSMDDFSGDLLPVSDPRSASAIRRRSDHNSRYRSMERWIHSIPFILLLVLLILWWFSYPVNLMINEEGIREVYPSDQVELAILGDHVGMQIIASSPLNFTSIGGARD